MTQSAMANTAARSFSSNSQYTEQARQSATVQSVEQRHNEQKQKNNDSSVSKI